MNIKKYQVPQDVFNIVFLFLITIILFSCNTNDTNIFYKSTSTELIFKDTLEIINFQHSLLDELNENSNDEYKIVGCNPHKEILTKQPNKLNYPCEVNESDYEIYTFRENKYVFELNCKKKIEIDCKGLIFIFCYNDVISFLNSRKNEDSYYSVYKKYLELFLNLNNTNNVSSEINDSLISDLLNNIPFEMKLKNTNKILKKVEIKHLFTNYSKDIEHYIFDNDNNIFAYFIVRKYVH